MEENEKKNVKFTAIPVNGKTTYENGKNKNHEFLHSWIMFPVAE